MKLTVNKAGTEVALKDGRKNVWKVEVPAGVSAKALEGLIAGTNADATEQAAFEAALAALAAKRGSVIPDDYRHQYGADQNCGDVMAADLKQATTNPDGTLDMAAVERIASQNGVGDSYDKWVSRGLNNGMVRMNLGNVLRAKVRKGDEVRI